MNHERSGYSGRHIVVETCIEFFGSSILTVRRFNVPDGRRLNWLEIVNKPIELQSNACNWINKMFVLASAALNVNVWRCHSRKISLFPCYCVQEDYEPENENREGSLGSVCVYVQFNTHFASTFQFRLNHPINPVTWTFFSGFGSPFTLSIQLHSVRQHWILKELHTLRQPKRETFLNGREFTASDLG